MLRIRDKEKFIRGISIIIGGIVIVVVLMLMMKNWIINAFKNKEVEQTEDTKVTSLQNNLEDYVTHTNTIQASSPAISTKKSANEEIINQWNLKLVNKDNSVDRSYVPELEELDDGIMFDKRAIKYLRNMISAMYKDGITKIWVASAYRSYDKQEELFNNKVEYYKKEGKKQEEAEKLSQTVVQRPEMSEHNLALAADFNTVSNDFEETKAFKWLQKNAEDYGFILRYPKDKQDITGITYESWHWRYVGKEHAKVMNEKGYCLEEYIEYLRGVEEV